MSDRTVIQCNIAEARDGVVPTDARCYVVRLNPGSGHERIPVLCRSRGGRWIERWESTANLLDFRYKILPPEHPRYGDERIWDANPGEAEALEQAADTPLG